MPRRVLSLARKLRHHEPFYIELLSGLAAVVWGIYSHMSRTRLEDSPIYAPLTAHASGGAIEAASVVLGVAQLCALYRDGPGVRAAVACVLCMWWALPARLILDSETGAPAVVVYVVFGVLGNCVTVWVFAPRLLAALAPSPVCRVARAVATVAGGAAEVARAGLRRLRRAR